MGKLNSNSRFLLNYYNFLKKTLALLGAREFYKIYKDNLDVDELIIELQYVENHQSLASLN